MHHALHVLDAPGRMDVIRSTDAQDRLNSLNLVRGILI